MPAGRLGDARARVALPAVQGHALRRDGAKGGHVHEVAVLAPRGERARRHGHGVLHLQAAQIHRHADLGRKRAAEATPPPSEFRTCRTVQWTVRASPGLSERLEGSPRLQHATGCLASNLVITTPPSERRTRGRPRTHAACRRWCRPRRTGRLRCHRPCGVSIDTSQGTPGLGGHGGYDPHEGLGAANSQVVIRFARSLGVGERLFHQRACRSPRGRSCRRRWRSAARRRRQEPRPEAPRSAHGT